MLASQWAKNEPGNLKVCCHFAMHISFTNTKLPNRDGGGDDMLLDFVGIVCMILCGYRLKSSRLKRSWPWQPHVLCIIPTPNMKDGGQGFSKLAKLPRGLDAAGHDRALRGVVAQESAVWSKLGDTRQAPWVGSRSSKFRFEPIIG